MSEYALTHTEYECIKQARSLIIKPCRRTYTYHKEKKVVLIHPGDIVKYEKHNKINGNIKTEIFVADGLDISNNKVCYGTKNKKFKYCKRILSTSIPYISKRLLQI